MSRNEFLKSLEEYLKDNVLDETKNEQISYYNNFIDTEVRNGRTEEDVINELGDPKLIAKTIIQVHPGEKKVSENASDVRENSNTPNSDAGRIYSSDNGYYNKENSNSNEDYSYNNSMGHVYQTSCLGCLVISILLTILLNVAIRIIFGTGRFIFNGINYSFGPVVGPVIVFLIIYFVFFHRRK